MNPGWPSTHVPSASAWIASVCHHAKYFATICALFIVLAFVSGTINFGKKSLNFSESPENTVVQLLRR